MEHHNRNDADRLGVDEKLVSERSRRKHNVIPGEISIIDVRDGLDVEVDRGEYRHEREHGRGVGRETPPQAFACAVDGTEQGTHTLKVQNDDNP